MQTTSITDRTRSANVPDWKRPAMFGYALIIFTFLVMGGWSAMAKLDSAAIAPGVLTIETNRKTVQHLEGGIVREILVREGMRVQEGEPLIRLDTTQARANLDLQQNQLVAALAMEARLMAERNQSNEPLFPAELTERSSDPIVLQAINDQLKQFAERRASLSGQTNILESRISQLRTEMDGLAQEQTATDKQLGYVDQQLADLRYLLDRNLVQKTRVFELDREKSRLEGVKGRSVADMAKAEKEIGEAQLQIRQLRQKFAEDVNGQIPDVRQKIADLRERVRVANDVLARTTITAPRTGVVQNLKVFTIGGVVRAGEPLLDIAPDNENLIVQAHVSPLDIENVVPGMRAEVRISSVNARLLPIMYGEVKSVSRDRLVDDASKQPYFLAQVEIDRDTVPASVRNRLTAGMVTDVVLPTGERTVLDYIVRPLQDRLRKSMREQ